MLSDNEDVTDIYIISVPQTDQRVVGSVHQGAHSPDLDNPNTDSSLSNQHRYRVIK